jgi:hypothetical protein
MKRIFGEIKMKWEEILKIRFGPPWYKEGKQMKDPIKRLNDLNLSDEEEKEWYDKIKHWISKFDAPEYASQLIVEAISEESDSFNIPEDWYIEKNW